MDSAQVDAVIQFGGTYSGKVAPASEAAAFLAKVPLKLLFTLVVAPRHEHHTHAVTAVRAVCASEAGPEILKSADVLPHVTAGMGHATLEHVREFCTSLLDSLVRDAASALELVQGPLGEHLLGQLADASTAVATTAERIFAKAAKLNPKAALFLLSAETLAKLHRLAEDDSQTRMRVYNFTFRISLVSDEAFQRFVTTMFPDVLKIFDGTDLLLQLTAIELLTEISQSSRGLIVLHTSEAMTKLASLLPAERATVGLLVSTTLSLFENFFRGMRTKSSSPPAAATAAAGKDLPPLAELLTQEPYSLIAGLAAQHFENADETVIVNAVSALCAIASSEPGLAAVLADPETNKALHFTSKLATAALVDEPVRLAALHGLAEVLSSSFKPASPQAVAQLDLFQGLAVGRPEANGPLDALFKHVIQCPFIAQRCAAYKLVQAACRHAFGVRAVHFTEGFVGFLLDRRTESTKEGHEWKFLVVKQVAKFDAAELEKLFDGSTRRHFARYIEKGPFAPPDAGSSLPGGTLEPSPVVATETYMG